MQITLKDLGFTPFFAGQVPENSDLSPFRITEVHRDRLSALSPDGPSVLTTKLPLQTSDFAVGDWVLADENAQINVVLERQSLLHRRAAGTHASRQLIAANCETLFITSSCNPDFNTARIERYLALAYEAGCFPVIVLTKADQSDEAPGFARRAGQIDARVPVLTVNALDADDLALVASWCGRGQTAALVGSSGVGKTTLTNGLCGRDDDTGGIREDDAHGRHVTTSRALRRMQNGGWIIDTPGMRALRLEEAGDGIDAVFDDIARLAATCRFSDCAHESEPGCAVLGAVEAGDLAPDRMERWAKLKREDIRNSQTLAESRARGKAFGKMVKAAAKDTHWRRKR